MDQVKGGVSPMKRWGKILWGIGDENGGLVLLFTLVSGVCSDMFVPFLVRDGLLGCLFLLDCLFFFSFLSLPLTEWWHYILKCNIDEYTMEQ